MVEYLPLVFICTTSGVMVISYGVYHAVKFKDRVKYGNVDSKLLFEKRVDSTCTFLARSRFLARLMKDLSLKLSIFNAKSYAVNMRYATLFLILFVLVFLILAGVLTVVFFPLWYIAMFYLLLFASIVCLGLIFLASYANKKFLSHMPETLRILSARYASLNNIVKCIGVSIEDFHKSIRGDMIRIYDALKQNDMDRIKDTFSAIDGKYSNIHMSLLLELIWHAYYNGGDEVVKGQFNDMLEDIIDDIENSKDLSAAALGYIGMGLAFAFAVPAARIFNEKVLGAESIQFYSGRGGIMLGLVYYAILVGFAFLIFVIERS